MKTYTAGGVVVGSDGRILVVNQHGNSWSLPKGHVEAKESLRQAAEREVFEETGIKSLHFIKKLGSYERYRIGAGGQGDDTSELKNITFFLYTTSETKLEPQDSDNPEARWLDADKVTDLLTHPKDKTFFSSILPQLKTLNQ